MSKILESLHKTLNEITDNLIISTKGEELMNNMQLKGKTAVVTGSGRGLGKGDCKKTWHKWGQILF